VPDQKKVVSDDIKSSEKIANTKNISRQPRKMQIKKKVTRDRCIKWIENTTPHSYSKVSSMV
jgi:hypothetical protein